MGNICTSSSSPEAGSEISRHSEELSGGPRSSTLRQWKKENSEEWSSGSRQSGLRHWKKEILDKSLERNSIQSKADLLEWTDLERSQLSQLIAQEEKYRLLASKTTPNTANLTEIASHTSCLRLQCEACEAQIILYSKIINKCSPSAI